jgi:chromate reductase
MMAFLLTIIDTFRPLRRLVLNIEGASAANKADFCRRSIIALFKRGIMLQRFVCQNTMRILAISGSLRAASSNTAALQAAANLAPAGTEIVFYKDLGSLPHFNPDLDTDDPPEVVKALRHEVGLCSGIVICSPEYAHGIAGSMKNALDWLVSSLEFPEKPVALINTSQRAIHAPAQLREILTTMSARLIDDASITLPLWSRNLDAAAIASDPALSDHLRTALEYFVAAIQIPARTNQ